MPTVGDKDNNTPKQEIICYVHSTSPIKKSGTLKYFNCTLQTSATDVQRAVCFVPERKATFDALENQKSPMKISNYRTSNKYGHQDIVIQKYTNLTAVPELQGHFQYQPVADTGAPLSIASLANVAPHQLITVKGYLSQLAAVKTLVISDSEPLKKQEAFIVDQTGHIKVVLWAEHTGQLEQGKTYLFKNLRLKQNNGVKYLNTPKEATGLSIEETEHFPGPLHPMDGIELVTTKEAHVSILGIQSTNKSHVCCSCTKRITLRPNGKIAFCESCNLTQKVSTDHIQWSVKMHLQDKDDKNVLRLFAYNQIVNKLVSLCDNPPNLKSCAEEDLTESLLELDSLSIVYDTQQRKITDVSL